MLNNFSISERKVAIIGAGFVGASIAYALTIRKLAREIVLIDIHEEKTIGEALDIQHGIPDMGISSVKAGNYEDCKDCDLIIITAGRNQCTKWMGLPNGMVFGTGCILDSSRFTRLIADYTRLNTEVVKATIVGEHGDAQIPIWSRVSIAGVPIQEYCENVGLRWGENKVREMGATIIKGKGRTHYGIATCVCYLAEAVLNQRLTIAPVSTMFQGEYGIEDVCLSVPSIIGVNGVEKRLEERWAEEEFLAFRQAAEKMRNVLKTL